MNRTSRILLIFLALCWIGAVAELVGSEPPKRPNFLFIITDDQAPFSLGAYGNQVCQTPNLDALAKRGMRIEQAYHMGAFQGAVCTASRHMIMSGRTLWHIPGARWRDQVVSQMNGKPLRRGVSNPNVPKDLHESTMAAVFNRAGYDTMRTCKIGNSYKLANQQFTVVKDKSNRRETADNGSQWHADQVLDYLEQRETAKDEDPFLIYFGFSHPHDPRYGSEGLLQDYGAQNQLPKSATVNPDSPALPVNYLPSHPFHHGHVNLRDEVAVQGVGRNRDAATIRNEKGREYACIENIDTQVGRVIDKLKAMGELENTYVFFTSDHGIAIGRHGLMGKQSLYEHSWRVPFLVAGPGIRPGSKARGNIYLLDTLATLCDLAGIPSPNTNEGKSFKPVLKGATDTIRDVLYGCYCGGTKPGMRAVRKGDWKLIKYETLDGEVKETQLFNLAENPNELIAEHHAEEVVKLTGNRPSRTKRTWLRSRNSSPSERKWKKFCLPKWNAWEIPIGSMKDMSIKRQRSERRKIVARKVAKTKIQLEIARLRSIKSKFPQVFHHEKKYHRLPPKLIRFAVHVQTSFW